MSSLHDHAWDGGTRVLKTVYEHLAPADQHNARVIQELFESFYQDMRAAIQGHATSQTRDPALPPGNGESNELVDLG